MYMKITTYEKHIIQSRYAVVWNAHFHHQDHLDFVKHFVNVYLLKKVVLMFNGWLLILCDRVQVLNGGIYSQQFIMLLCRKRCLHESQMKTFWLSFVNPRKGRSSRSQMLFKIDVLKNFTKKHLFWNLFLINYRTPPVAAFGRGL